MKEIKNKKSQLCFEPKVSRKLLKMNGELKFCPYCGVALTDGCECHKNIIIDIKANRENTEKTIFVFDNNEQFKADFSQLMDELKAKKEAEVEIEFEGEIEVEINMD
jgi:hypothetical protein